MINLIMIPVDGSDRDEMILNYGAQLAEKLDARVLVTTVFEPDTYMFGLTNVVDDSEIMQKMKDRSMGFLTAAKPILDKYHLSYQTLLKQGDPRHILASELVETYHPDLIIMGKTGGHKIERVLVGSTARYVSENSKTNVLLVD